jgi:hypothetical protein
MARTVRNRRSLHPYRDGGYDKRSRRRYLNKERKDNRKNHFSSYRAKVKNKIHEQDWELIPRFRRTCGWLTW